MSNENKESSDKVSREMNESIHYLQGKRTCDSGWYFESNKEFFGPYASRAYAVRMLNAYRIFRRAQDAVLSPGATEQTKDG